MEHMLRWLEKPLGRSSRTILKCYRHKVLEGVALLTADEDHYRVSLAEHRNNSVTAKIESRSTVAVWWLTAMYGPQEDNGKILFLQELRYVRQAVSDKWLMDVDFNMILQATDKSNSNLNRRIMEEFRNPVQDLELPEICLKGRKFTWSSKVRDTDQ